MSNLKWIKFEMTENSLPLFLCVFKFLNLFSMISQFFYDTFQTLSKLFLLKSKSPSFFFVFSIIHSSPVYIKKILSRERKTDFEYFLTAPSPNLFIRHFPSFWDNMRKTVCPRQLSLLSTRPETHVI